MALARELESIPNMNPTLSCKECGAIVSLKFPLHNCKIEPLEGFTLLGIYRWGTMDRWEIYRKENVDEYYLRREDNSPVRCSADYAYMKLTTCKSETTARGREFLAKTTTQR